MQIKFAEKVADRVYDEFDRSWIQKNDDGSMSVTVTFPEDQWVYGYILSYGCHATVVSPKRIHELISRRFAEGWLIIHNMTDCCHITGSILETSHEVREAVK